jgi:ACT domain-containing protein
VVVRLAGDPAQHLHVVRPFDAAAKVDEHTMVLRLPDAEGGTPGVVAALVAAGAQILEVQQEIPALEDVYLHLMGERR